MTVAAGFVRAPGFRGGRVPAAVIDFLIAALTMGFSLGNDLGAHSPDRPHVPWAWAFDLALVLPLSARRRFPLPVFLLISAVACAQWLVDIQAVGDVAVLVALCAVGLYERRLPAIAGALVIAEIGVVMATLRWAPTPHRFAAGLLMTGTVTAALVFGVYVRTRRSYVASVLERAATAERERDHQAVIASAAERARISREMHDIVAHSLSVMIALSDGAAMSVTRTPSAAQDAMEKSAVVGRQALEEMRRLLGVLRDPDIADDASELPQPPQPGLGQLENLIQQVRAAGLDVELVVTGPLLDLPPGVQLAAFRIVQEGLTNVLKHAAGAHQVAVRLAYSHDLLAVEVENDDTIGDRAVAATSMHGQGLTGMRERAAVFGGTVEAGRRTDGGWLVATQLHVEGLPDQAARR